MAHSFANLLAHVVFSTKERTPYIDAELKARLFPYMGGILRELKVKPLIINGVPDHVHLLLSLPATLAPADVIRVLKTNASRWVHETFPERRAFAWQTGYAAFSVSQSNLESVRMYIANQEAHHRKMPFKEELIELLKKHGIEYDERDLWD